MWYGGSASTKCTELACGFQCSNSGFLKSVRKSMLGSEQTGFIAFYNVANDFIAFFGRPTELAGSMSVESSSIFLIRFRKRCIQVHDIHPIWYVGEIFQC